MEQVYEYIEANWLDAIDDLKRLLSQPSISAQGTGIQEAAALTAGLLQEYGMPSRILPTPGGPPVVYGELEGDSPFTLLFYNHYDVQPPEPLELWSTPPFEPSIADGKLYARGVSDNKG
ncbi:M20/M25/M40 family metallo-hydrolase [Dehalococcoidia bacterium]|nr:M20/M25/M40 family metallo-hydrolase [Dehalococcoidia bacterium]